MKWSWKLVRLAGIDLYVHATFFLLIAWVGLSYWRAEGTLTAVLGGVGFILALFACVVLHELGHALTARRYGIRTRNITLLPIGGVAALERMPEDPKQEIIVALAGPAVNLVIAACLWAWLSLSNALVGMTDVGFTGGVFLQQLMLLNVVLAVFNLLPAFPMDGGRVLRAALSMRLGRSRATQIAARVGQGLALCMGILGMLYNPFLMFIAIFIWFGATAEAGMEQVKSSLSDISVGHAMLTDFQTLSPDDSLGRAIELTLAGSQKAFPVLENGRIIGVLTQHGLLRGLQATGEDTRVEDWMQKKIQSAQVDEPVHQVLNRLQRDHCPLISVMSAGKLVGIIDLDNISELIQIQAAIQEQRQNPSWRA
jgi:Zn-dependent protease/predicted transcriptional regulator